MTTCVVADGTKPLGSLTTPATEADQYVTISTDWVQTKLGYVVKRMYVCFISSVLNDQLPGT